MSGAGKKAGACNPLLCVDGAVCHPLCHGRVFWPQCGQGLGGKGPGCAPALAASAIRTNVCAGGARLASVGLSREHNLLAVASASRGRPQNACALWLATRGAGVPVQEGLDRLRAVAHPLCAGDVAARKPEGPVPCVCAALLRAAAGVRWHPEAAEGKGSCGRATTRGAAPCGHFCEKLHHRVCNWAVFLHYLPRRVSPKAHWYERHGTPGR